MPPRNGGNNGKASASGRGRHHPDRLDRAEHTDGISPRGRRRFRRRRGDRDVDRGGGGVVGGSGVRVGSGFSVVGSRCFAEKGDSCVSGAPTTENRLPT